jgi:hypothetical protein
MVQTHICLSKAGSTHRQAVNEAKYKAHFVNHILLKPNYPTRSRIVKKYVTDM